MKNQNWLDKSVTWRSYLWLSAISMALSTIGCAIYYIGIYWDVITRKLDELTDRVKSKSKPE